MAFKAFVVLWICSAQAIALANAGLTQNETPANQLSKFSNSLTMIQVQPLNAEQKNTSILSEELSYTLSETQSLTLATGFTYVWSKYASANSNQLDDFSLSLFDSDPGKLGTTTRALDASATLGLPTSESSQKSGFNGSFGFGAGYTFIKNSWQPRLGVFQNFNSYKYDTYGVNSNVFVNTSSTTYSIGLSHSLIKKTKYSLSGQLIDLSNANRTQNSIYSISNTISQSVNKNLSLALSFFTQNRLVENTKLYNNDTSSWRFILTLMN